MQLDLFCDNRRTIRLNDADELLRALRLEDALAVYAALLIDEPDDAELLALRQQVAAWHERLSLFHTAVSSVEGIHSLWLNLTPETPPALAVSLLHLLVDNLCRLPSPELIYRPPQFHLGTLLLDAGRCAEAAYWFGRALDAGISERGRFLAWRGAALTRQGDLNLAQSAYLAAFIEGPQEVDFESQLSPLIQDLLGSLENEEHDFSAEALPAWLPVWGWLQGEFALPLQDIVTDRAAFVQALDDAHAAHSQPVARLWFDDLRYAEYLRTAFRNDRELVRVRRRMREQNDFMFEAYMERMRRTLG
ncbi:MAG: hypothetical protein K0A93_07815 [Desulfuromonadaceae bacterium]|nr:hypothetical protein [Desulfuromonadaceae bacterium]